MERFLDQLNEAQREATVQTDGPMIVIAGAGSGKTRVLTYKIAYLISKGVDPFNILSLTFTNKAAKEMKTRIAEIVGESEAKNLWMGTFHSVFAKLLRADAPKLGFPSNFTIYDTQDAQRLISAIIGEMGLDKEIYKYKQIYGRISSYKNSLITVRAYFQNPELQEADAAARREKMGEIYQNYVERCFKAGAMDFDDLLLRTNELLTRFPDVLAKYQERFKYILVDEYQDTNHSQYLIVRALSDRYQNICVVGDDAQSIYAFRGANIDNILNFQRDYDNTKVFRLEQNYRSTKTIVNAANSIIDKNQVKLDKVVWTANEEGNSIKVHRLLTDGDEGRFVVSSIFENKMNHQLHNKSFAVLYRTNAQSRAIEDALRKRDIPYRIYGGLSFYQRKEIKDVLSYLRLVINPADEEALKRVINFPARGIGQTTIDKLIVGANTHQVTIFELLQQLDNLALDISAGIKTKLKNFATLIESFQVMNQKVNAFELAEHVTKATGLMKSFGEDLTPEGIARMENIEELLNGIKDFVDGQQELVDASGSLVEFLEDVSLATDLDQEDDNDDKVALMTIHLAKGLEFPYVYIVGMEEDLFPSALSLNTRSELEEERRLFYVALTRAEKQAYLTYTLSRYRWGRPVDAEPSRFIQEIDEKYLEFATPPPSQRSNPMLDASIFGDVPQNTVRFKRPSPAQKPHLGSSLLPINLKPVGAGAKALPYDGEMSVGLRVSHMRFGKGTIVALEGRAADQNATIHFDQAGEKKLLLRFAKLDLIDP